MTRASHPQPRLVPREQGVGWAQNVSHTPAWTLERGHQSPGPEVLCARNSKLVQVGSHSTKMTPLRGDLCAPPLLQGPQNTPQTPPPTTNPSKLFMCSLFPLPFFQVSSQNFSSIPPEQGQGHYPSPLKGRPKLKWIARKPPKGTRSCTLPWLLETT